MNMNFFWKNSAGTKISPATQATLAAMKAQTDLLSYDADTNANLQVNAAAGNVQAKNASGALVNPATEDTLALIRVQIDKFTFSATTNALATTGPAPALSDSVNMKDATSTLTNPASEEKVQLWRRMVKILESHGTVDASNTQRVSLDSFGATQTGIGLSGDGVPLVTMASDLVRVIPGVSTPTTFVGAGNQYFQDHARNAYARSIRRNLIFS
jgi:hypothetical protein